MPDVLLRNLPATLVRRLKADARENRRSLQAELHAILERHARAVSVAETLRRARAWQLRFSERPRGDSVSDLREDRERR